MVLKNKQRVAPIGAKRKPSRSPAAKPALADGKVGIFWWHRSRLLAATFPLSEGDETSLIIDSPVNHVDHWPVIQRQQPKLRHLGYEEVPRGRVIYAKETRMFCIYMDLKLHREPVKAALRRAFGLTGQKVRFDTDPHYTTDKKQLEILFGKIAHVL